MLSHKNLFKNKIPYDKKDGIYDVNHYNKEGIEIVALELANLVKKIIK